MTHFGVLVTKTNKVDLETQLAPFDENLEKVWVDKTEEYKKQYDIEEISEFYSASYSSWGFSITKELFERIKASKLGTLLEYQMEKSPGEYLGPGNNYCGYYTVVGANGQLERCKDDAWFKMVKILETDQPSLDVRWEGKARIKVIKAPRKIAFKDQYPDYETYLRDCHGVEDLDKQGYWNNPLAKWDQYSVWTGYFKLKEGARGRLGRPDVDGNKPDYNTGIALVKDINWQLMADDQRKKAEEQWAEYEAKLAASENIDLYFFHSYGIEKDDTKESYIKRESSIATFAVLHDGEWYEKDKRGWWATVANEKSPGEWQAKFDEIIASLDPDDEVTVVDVHI